MNSSLYEQLCKPQTLLLAWSQIAGRDKASGVDSQSVSDFGRQLAANLEKLSGRLYRGQFEPSPLRAVDIPKQDPGKFRRLGIPTVTDRVVFKATNNLLQEYWKDIFSPLSFAYRCGTGVVQAIDMVADCLSNDRTWFVKGDIRGCFDSLNWDILSQRLREHMPEDAMRALLNKSVRVPVVRNGRIITRRSGIPQGSPVSPILANLYLRPFDECLLKQRFPLIRYADDWLILVHDQSLAERAFFIAVHCLERLGIDINPRKSGIGCLRNESIVFLGHHISAEQITTVSDGWLGRPHTIAAARKCTYR